jgi:hypothetical protein
MIFFLSIASSAVYTVNVSGFPFSRESTCRQVGTKKGENVIPAKAGIQFLFISGFSRIKYGTGSVKHGMTALTTPFRVNNVIPTPYF